MSDFLALQNTIQKLQKKPGFTDKWRLIWVICSGLENLAYDKVLGISLVFSEFGA